MKIRRGVTGHQILFLVSFFIGIVIVTVLANGKLPENTLMSQALAGGFLAEGWNRRELFLQCLWKRAGVLFLILTLLFPCTAIYRIWDMIDETNSDLSNIEINKSRFI